jgi:catechol 2,3-dioxygenase-like lactoylglutathione lyase family enzyme
MITGLHHINLVVPPQTLPLANDFYGTTLGLTPRAVPQAMQGSLAWFDIGTSGQQVHIAFGKPEDFQITSNRHPCFRVGSGEELEKLKQRVCEHFEKGGEAAPKEAPRQGAQGSEYPNRFFARDYAGNLLEFSV